MNRKLSVVLPVLIPDQFCIAMTEFCIKAMRLHAMEPFELVVVETGSRFFDPANHPPEWDCRPDKYLHRMQKTTFVQDWNDGADAASGDLLVHTGNDVIAGQEWDRALKEPFDLYRDCGMSTTSVIEPGVPAIGHAAGVDNFIVEGWMTAFCCFDKRWRFDTMYESGYSDTDLLMRIYSAGMRSYRNYCSVAYHLGRVTWKRVLKNNGEGEEMFRGEEKFYARWRNSPLWAYAMIRSGAIKWGEEHAAKASLTPVEIRQKTGG